MFTFDTIEKSLYGGVSPSIVPDAARNRFSMVFGCDALDNRIQVKISERQVRFFYYDHDYKQCDWNPTRVQDYDYLKEIGFITLTRRKDAGNDILAFPQNIGGLDLYDEKGKTDNNCLKIWKSITDCVNQWVPEFYDFPFLKYWKEPDWKQIESLNKEVRRRRKEDAFRCFVRCCLLNFIYEFENRGQSFGASPIYDKVRDKLRESDVYNLLSAKIQYTQYLYKGQHLSRNQEKYTYYTQKFADCLMDKRLNKVIPPDNYGFGDDKQGWFFDPEEELEHVLETNRKHKEERKGENDNTNVATLKESLVTKIRSFFYTKHAVFKAMTTIDSKDCFVMAQALMLLGNVLLIVSSCFFSERFWIGFFRYRFLIIGFMILTFVILFIGLSGWLNGSCSGRLNSIINAFFPRIVVAEVAAWLTIGIAEDLIKSMLWVEHRWVIVIAIVLVMALVSVLIYGETKQHSPYCRGKNVIKSLLVLNHSVYFALVMGCFMQFVFYNNLLKTSEALTSVVYKDHFDKVENYLYRLEALDNSLKEYKSFAQYYFFTNVQRRGDNTGKTELSGKVNIYNQDSLTNSMNLYFVNQIGFGTKTWPSVDTNVYRLHDDLVDDIINGFQTIDNCESFSIKHMVQRTDSLAKKQDTIVDPIILENTKVIYENVQVINDQLSPKLALEIRESRNHQMDDCYDTLIRWATANEICSNTTQSTNVNNLIKEAKQNKCAINVSGLHFYPYLLLFHTLIVLVLAFITQLIISDKSVTEPL